VQWCSQLALYALLAPVSLQIFSPLKNSGMDIDQLRLLHIQAGKHLHIFRNSICHAEKNEKDAANQIDTEKITYSLRQASLYRKAAVANLEQYQGVHQQILTITENIIACTH
jgi:hypothetical protein